MTSQTSIEYGLNERITTPGSLGVGVITNESKVRFVITNAGPSNLIRIRVRINNQPNWTTLANFTGNVSQIVNVFTWDELEVITLVYQSLSDQVSIVAASFDGAKVTITTPGGTITDVNTMAFTSTDNSVIITANETLGTVNFASVGTGGSNFSASFTIADWTGPVGSTWVYEVPSFAHNKANPIVEVFELIALDDYQVYVETIVDSTNNVKITVPVSPDLRFDGKLIIS